MKEWRIDQGSTDCKGSLRLWSFSLSQVGVVVVSAVFTVFYIFVSVFEQFLGREFCLFGSIHVENGYKDPCC